jgi:hypothetical protein
MKIIKYKFMSCEINHGTEEKPDIEQIFLEKSMGWSEANEAIAKQEAHNGEYIIEDDGIEEIAEPTQLDIIEAQVTYTAMMTDTLLEV